MDALEQFFGGNQTRPSSQSNAPVNNPGNLRPVGASTGFQQYTSPEQGLAAADSNLKAYGEKYGINTLRGVITRYAPPTDNNNTESYINTVAQKVGLDPDQKIDLSDPVQRHVINGAMFTVEKGPKNLFKVGQAAQPTAAPVSASADPLESFFSGQPVATAQPAQVAQAPQPATTGTAEGTMGAYVPRPTVGPVAAKVAGIANKYLQAKQNLGERTAGAFDTLYGIVPATYGAVIQGLARTAQTPEQAAQTGQAAATSVEKPVGKFTGIRGKETYQQPLGGFTQPIAEQINKMFNVLGMTPEQISEKTSVPAADIRNMVVIGSVALPQVAKEVGSVVGKVVQPLRQMAGELELVRPNQSTVPNQSAMPGQALTKEQMAAQFAERQKQATQEATQPPTQTPAQPVATNLETGMVEPLGTAKPTTPDAPYTELKYAENYLPVDEQMARAETLRKVMGTDFQADMAAIQGKGKERATNYATSNTDTSIGNFLKDKFTDEQNRLSKYINNQVKETGGTVGLDESSVYKRGNTILKPLQEFEDYFDKATEKIYSERDAMAKEVPVTADNVLSKLNDRTLVEISDPAERLAKTAKVKMQQLGMLDEAGNLLPTDAYHAELFRKWLNQNWSREANQLHKALKNAVDDDVIAKLDTNSPIYKDARALVELRKNTLDNPKGISNILDAEGPKGINRKVQIEKIAQNIADMPVEQFTHVVDTLKNVPEALQPSATKALSEIKAQFLNQLSAKKTPKQITDFMNGNSEVMNRLFTPKEMADIREYHNASHILATDTGYKGAAVQKINVEKKLGTKVVEQLLQKGTAAGAEFVTGGAGMGVPAVVTHEIIGSRLAKREAKRQAKAEESAFRATQQRFVPLSDLLPPKQ